MARAASSLCLATAKTCYVLATSRYDLVDTCRPSAATAVARMNRRGCFLPVMILVSGRLLVVLGTGSGGRSVAVGALLADVSRLVAAKSHAPRNWADR